METLRGVLLVAALLACGLLAIATPTGYVKRSPSRSLMYTGYFTGGRGADPHRQYLAKPEEEEAPLSRGESGTDAEHDQVTEEAEHQVQEEKKRPKSPKRQHDEEDEDEDEESRGAAPSFNAYFPLMFGGGWPRMGGGKKHNRGGSSSGGGGGGGGGWGMMAGGDQGEGGQMPGVATAIANSFSTGRGAVASSHAVAYGAPHHKRTSSGTKPKTDW